LNSTTRLKKRELLANKGAKNAVDNILNMLWDRKEARKDI